MGPPGMWLEAEGEDGAIGPPGPQGPQGPAGEDGAAGAGGGGPAVWLPYPADDEPRDIWVPGPPPERGIEILDPKSFYTKRYGFFEDFFQTVGTATNPGNNSTYFVGFVTGTGTAVQPADAVANHAGIISIECGTTSTGAAILMSQLNNVNSVVGPFILGNGTIRWGWLVFTPAALSDASQDYRLSVGLAFLGSSADASDGVYFRYNDGVNSGKWQAVAALASAETTLDTGVTVAVDTWYWLECVVNPAGSSAEFFVDGVSAGSIASNLPTRTLGMTMGIRKTLGTTERFFRADIAYLYGELNR
jgi:hypothetical protein